MDVSADYCRRLANWIRRDFRVDDDVALALEDVPPPPCGTTSAGSPVPCVYLSGPPRKIRATTSSGKSFADALPCGGISMAAICYEHPPLQAFDLGMQGYWDVPCTGEAPEGCATPIAPDPDAVRAAKPLKIATLDIPVGDVGHREIEIGTASLPNGILTVARFSLADDSQMQRGFIIDPTYIGMKIVSTDASRPPFMNVYQRKRIKGVEDVRVLLVYDVLETSPDAVLHIKNIEVR